MVIEALNIPNVKYVDVDLLAEDHLKEEFLKLNPQHTIPMLTDDKFVVWDSHAIATYLLNKYGKGSSYYPEDPEKRALIEMRLHFDSGILYPALRENDEPIFFWGETTFKPQGLAKIKSAYDFTEKFLSDSPWIAGDDVTVADMSCVATIGSLDALLPINEKEYPKITSWLKRCSELDFYQRGNNVKGLLEFKALLKQYLSRGKE